MVIAVVSKDGVHVDDHFGRAERFLIYAIAAEKQTLLRVENVEKLSENYPAHKFNEKKFAGLLQALDGCERVYCTKIGEKPAQELKDAGIEPVVYSGSIADIPL
jgi:predicted Fe-Mo cluster-binding NifX family protein